MIPTRVGGFPCGLGGFPCGLGIPDVRVGFPCDAAPTPPSRTCADHEACKAPVQGQHVCETQAHGCMICTACRFDRPHHLDLARPAKAGMRKKEHRIRHVPMPGCGALRPSLGLAACDSSCTAASIARTLRSRSSGRNRSIEVGIITQW